MSMSECRKDQEVIVTMFGKSRTGTITGIDKWRIHGPERLYQIDGGIKVKKRG